MGNTTSGGREGSEGYVETANKCGKDSDTLTQRWGY